MTITHYSKSDIDKFLDVLMNEDEVKREKRYFDAYKVWINLGDETKSDDNVLSMNRKGNKFEYQIFLTILSNIEQYEHIIFTMPAFNNFVYHMITEYKLTMMFGHGTSQGKTWNQMAKKKEVYDEKKKRITQYHNKKLNENGEVI